MLIRTATHADIPTILGLVQQMGYPLDAEIRTPVAAQLLADPCHSILVAEDGATPTKVIGFIDVNIRRQLHHRQPVATIDELCVDGSCRGQGIGAKLLDAAVEAARTAGAEILELTSNKRRTEAIAFYQRRGFHITSEKLIYPLIEGAE